jgi:hypothetical protein
MERPTKLTGAQKANAQQRQTGGATLKELAESEQGRLRGSFETRNMSVDTFNQGSFNVS